MADVLIRNIDEKTLERLKAKAEKNNRSLQGELHEILREYVGPGIGEIRNMVNEILIEYKAEGRSFSTVRMISERTGIGEQLCD